MAAYKPKQNEIKKAMKDALRKLHGDKCMICGQSGIEFRKLRGEDADFVLEHRDGNPANYDLDNLQLACYSCNQLKRPDFQEVAAETGKVERENAGGSMTVSDSERLRRQRYLNRATPEFKKSHEIEPLVRRYLWENVSREGSLLLDDAIAEAAEYASCDVQTAARKITKATSRMGPFKVIITEVGNQFIKLREGYKPNLQTDMGRVDFEISHEILRTFKTEIQTKDQQAKEAMTVQARMAESYSYIAKQRDIAIREIMKATGKPYDEVKAMLDTQAPPPAHFDKDDDDSQPAAPVQTSHSPGVA